MFHLRLPDATLQKKLLEKPKIELIVQCGRKNRPLNDRELNHLTNLFRCEFYTSINSKKQKIQNKTKQNTGNTNNGQPHHMKGSYF